MSWRSQNGFTLIEMMIVMTIIAGGYLVFILFGFGGKSDVRQEIRNLASRIRYAYNLSATESRYYRLAFDLDAGTYRAEVSDEPIYVAKVDPEAEKKDDEPVEDSEEEAESAAPAFSESEDDLFEPYEIASDVKICSFFVEHQTEAITEGSAELNFFPGGQTEFAVIQLCNSDGEKAMTLSVNPVTGSVEVFDEAKDYEEILEMMQQK